MTDFRCSIASQDHGEPLAGTAPSDTRWLFVEHPGPWTPKALAASPMPQGVRRRLQALESGSSTGDPFRVQLIRRPGRPGQPDLAGASAGGGVRVYVAELSPVESSSRPEHEHAVPGAFGIRTVVLDHLEDLADLDDRALEATTTVYDPQEQGPLWFVCTHGRRDVCCAERGRPVASALSARWPEGTWETTHLGGHRFAATLLALPSGITLGRLHADPVLVETADEIAAGRMPPAATHDMHIRGRAGLPGPAQVAELHLHRQLGTHAETAVRVAGIERGEETDRIALRTEQGEVVVGVRTVIGEPRRQSCADDRLKPSTTYVVQDVAPGRT